MNERRRQLQCTEIVRRCREVEYKGEVKKYAVLQSLKRSVGKGGTRKSENYAGVQSFCRRRRESELRLKDKCLIV